MDDARTWALANRDPTASIDTYATWVDATSPGASVPWEGAMVAKRYHAIEPIGHGGFATVWRARDLVDGREVALKLIPVSEQTDLDDIRRESTALRWLSIPGVVGLQDEGIDDGRWFIAMDLVEGEPFPGLEPPSSWEALCEPVVRLVDTLARLHAAGVVHHDLKPSNVLVGADGSVTVLDFGIAGGRAIDGGERRTRALTPRYASPEQCRGLPARASSDVYSLGVILYEALTGSVPHGGVGSEQMVRLRGYAPAAPVASRCPGLPGEVAQLVDRTLAVSASDRPTAAEILAQLAPERAGLGVDLPTERCTSWRALKRLFAGPDRFLHLKTDAARELWRRTGGHPDRVRRELHAWRDLGHVQPTEEGLAITRPALEELAAGTRADPTPETPVGEGLERELVDLLRLGFPSAPPSWLARQTGRDPGAIDEALGRLQQAGRVWKLGRAWFAGAGAAPAAGWTEARRNAALRDLVRRLRGEAKVSALLQAIPSGVDEQELATSSLAIARDAWRRGSSRRAAQVVRRALSTDMDTGTKRQLLELRVRIAVAEFTEASLHEAIYLLDRHHSGAPADDPAHRVLRCALAVLRGQSQPTAEAMRTPPPEMSDELRRAWFLVRAKCALAVGPNELVQLLDEAPRAIPAAVTLGLRGMLHYRKGDYADAAASCEQAAQASIGAPQRLAHLLDAASAYLEMGAYEASGRVADRANRVARRARLARREVMATFVLRATAYRRGRAHAPRPELVPPAGEVASYAGGLLALNEAAVAWREGHPLAIPLANSAHSLLAAAGRPPAARLAACLSLAGRRDAEGAMETLSHLHPQPVDEILVQCAALLRLAGARAPVPWVEPFVQTRPMERRLRRLDVLSLQESLEACSPA